MSKTKYRIRNWKKYSKSLEERGGIDLWIDENALKKWHPEERTGKKGRPVKYSNEVIVCALIVRYVFRLALRQTQGFVRSFIRSLKVKLTEPDYTTICKRQKTVDMELVKKHKKGRKMYLLFDASGLKVFGEGEWKVRMHGYSKRRTWRKLHIGLAVKASGKTEIEVMDLTDKEMTDQEMLPEMLDQVEGEIKNIIGDGAYDTQRCHKAAFKRKAKMIAPPRKGATTNYKDRKKHPALEGRNKTVRYIKKHGMEAWKKATHYHVRSLVENVFSRLKTTMGEKLSSRKFENQKKEAFIKCAILNRMSELGMPDSYKVA